MADAKVIQCSVCSNKMKITPAHFGKKIRCTKCQSVLVINDEGVVAKAIPAEGAQGAATKSQTGAKASQAGAKKSQAAAAKSGTAKKSQSSARKSSKGAVKRAGKGELKPAKAVKKVAKGPKLNPKMKGKALGRVSAAERLEHIGEDKGTRRMWTLAGSLFGLAVVGVLAWYFTRPTPEPDTSNKPTVIDPFVNVTVQPDKTIDIETVNISGKDTAQVEVFVRNTDNMEFVKIPAGEYTVGSPVADTEKMEAPEVKVTINAGEEYWIGRNEVTNAQYLKFLDALTELDHQKLRFMLEADTWAARKPEYARKQRMLAFQHSGALYDHPAQPKNKTNHLPKVKPISTRTGQDQQAVYGVDWWDAYSYCNWANGMRPKRGILPTEIEWEIAARARRQYLYPWGDSPEDLDKVIEQGADAGMEPVEFIRKAYGDAGGRQGGLGNNPTGIIPTNGFGIQNITGNAAELCWDRFARGLYEFASQNPGKLGFLPDGDSQFEKYGSYKGQRAVRLSSVALEGASELRFTRRAAYDAIHQPYLSFRCVYYGDREAPYAAEIDACNSPDPSADWTISMPTLNKQSEESKAAFAERQKQAEADVKADQEILNGLHAKANEMASANGKAPTIWELADAAGITEQEARRLLQGQKFVGDVWFEDK